MPPKFEPMQWLLYGSVTPAVGDALVRHGHATHASGDLALPPESSPADVLHAAQQKQWDIVTNDGKLGEAVFADRVRYTRSIVWLQLEGSDVEQDDAIDRLFQRYKRLTPGRLYTVTASRVKVRQLPHRP